MAAGPRGRGLSPVLVPEDKLPQFQVPEDQSVVMAMRHGRSYLMEQSGGLFLPKLLAGADERVHVSMAPLEEDVGAGLAQQDLQDLVDVLVSAQGKVARQRLLVASNAKNLKPERGRETETKRGEERQSERERERERERETDRYKYLI